MSHTSYGSIGEPDVGFSGNQTLSKDLNSLCDNIVTNVYTINSSLKSLENALKVIGSAKDNAGVRNKVHVTQLSTNQIASECTKDINKLKLKVPKADKQRKLQVEKLEGNFRDAINKYYSLQKELASKQKAHLLIQESLEHEIDDDSEQNKQAQLAREMAFEQDMMLEREARVKQIESDVLDINQIMRELGSMVHAQGETLDTIENGIDNAAGNVEEGYEQLVKASRYQTSRRKKWVFIFLICMVAIAIVIGIIVTSLKR
ncbi:syntaxin-12 [Cylas formicarius]|uniref:syntaxin-12 n=1 Tax=Cylas formicarius TaxID=197179 RepID=UPI002958B8BC|nr:syntaxin-12 [Cylas formicarius]XP_060531439.1 syntaxin-12 [Cylas formicarius]